MPKPNLAPATYPSLRTVGLRVEKDVAAVYYPTDGTAATTSSKEYTGTPISLRKGKTTLRAIAVGANGKISYELNVQYVCEGKTKNSMLETDTFEGLTLLDTTFSQFESKYGKASSTQPGEPDALGNYTIGFFPFGYAAFLHGKTEEQEPTLAELSTTSRDMVGPRGVRVGMTLSDAMALFRDEGGEDDGQGNRLLYKLVPSGNMGQLVKTGDHTFEAHYYTKLTKDYIELVLYAKNDIIEKIDWVRYRV